MKKKFIRHFRIYFKNNHPAYIVDEEGNEYVFHRVTHSKTSGGKKTWKIPNNPVKGDYRLMHIVKREERDKSARFSKFIIELKPGVDVSYPNIKLSKEMIGNSSQKGGTKNKKTGSAQTKHGSIQGRANVTSSTTIKSKRKKRGKKKRHKKKPLIK